MSTPTPNYLSKNLLVTVITFGLFLTIAATISGYLIGSSLMRFKTNDRTITVKELVEKSITSDYAIWTIPFETHAKTLDEARIKLTSTKNIIRQFLHNQGFEDHEITFTATAVKDQATATKENVVLQPDVRFSIEAQVVVETKKAKLVQKAFSEIDELVAQGIILRVVWDNNRHPSFLCTQFNDLRPQMLKEAVINAQKMAIQFSKDTGVKIGSLRQANQGQFQIFGKNNPNNEYAQSESLEKIIRVVSTLQFDIEKQSYYDV